MPASELPWSDRSKSTPERTTPPSQAFWQRLVAIMRPHLAITCLSVIAMVLLGLLWAATLLQSQRDQQLSLQETRTYLLNITRTFKEHAQNTLSDADQALRLLRYQYEKRQTSDQTMLNEYISREIGETPYYNQVGIINAQGIYAYSNFTSQPPVDLSDREHFKVHRQQRLESVFISRPVVGRITQKWSIQVTRRLDQPNGSFGGVGVISLDPGHFVRFHRSIDLGQRGVVALIGLDGYARTLYLGNGEDPGSLQPHFASPLPLPPEVMQQQRGSFLSQNLFDGVTRLYAFERLRDYPILVLTGMDKVEALEEFRQRNLTYFQFGAIISLIIGLFAATSLHLLMRARRIHAELDASRRQADIANRHKSEFLAAMSHELRTPLNGIMGYSEHIQSEAQDPELQWASRVIHDSSTHLLSLVNSILDLTKIEAGKMTLDLEMTTLRPLVDEVCDWHRSRLGACDLTLNVLWSPSVPEQLRLDPVRFKQVLSNLVDNAIKFTPDQGKITVRALLDQEAKAVRFEIEDTGEGIPVDMQSHVFEKFWQQEDFITRRNSGTGLGLTLCKRLVELMGGRIGFRSTPGQGSCFYFQFPLKAPRTTEEAYDRH